MSLTLNENQILNLLNDGYTGDLDIPLDDEPVNELDVLLRNYANDDLAGYLETQLLTDDIEEVQKNEKIEVEDEFELSEEHSVELNLNSTDTQTTQNTLEYKNVRKKDIERINKPYQILNINLDNLEMIDHPIIIILLYHRRVNIL